MAKKCSNLILKNFISEILIRGHGTETEVIRGHATVAKNIQNPIVGMEKTLDATPATL